MRDLPPMLVVALVFVGLGSCSGRSVNIDITAGASDVILVPHGDDPNNSKQRMVIKREPGHDSLFPCLIAGQGTYENGQTFSKGNFHYHCKNGTAEVIACISEDKSVIQVGRTFLRDGIRHKCLIKGDTVTYEQKSTCFENGVHYDVGEEFRNGSFQLICSDNGAVIEGCYIQLGDVHSLSHDEIIPLGESRIIGDRKHNCEVMGSGKIRYTIHLLGCTNNNGNRKYKEGELWTDQHVKYECSGGRGKVIGCVDENGTSMELGKEFMMGSLVHRCYKVNNTTFYHRFQCERGKSLKECVDEETPKLKQR